MTGACSTPGPIGIDKIGLIWGVRVPVTDAPVELKFKGYVLEVYFKGYCDIFCIYFFFLGADFMVSQDVRVWAT